jgi:hypothetical protein
MKNISGRKEAIKKCFKVKKKKLSYLESHSFGAKCCYLRGGEGEGPWPLSRSIFVDDSKIYTF